MVNQHPVIRAFTLINQKRSHRINYATGFGLFIAFFIILLAIRMIVNLGLLWRLAPHVATGGFTHFLLVNFALILVYGCSVSALMIYRTQRDFLFHSKILTAPVSRQSINVAFLQAALLRAHVWVPSLLTLGALGLVMSFTGFNLFYLGYWLGFIVLFLTGTGLIFLVAIKTRFLVTDLEYLVSLLVLGLFFANPMLRVVQGDINVYLFTTINIEFNRFFWLPVVWLTTILCLACVLGLVHLVHLLIYKIRHRLKLPPALWSYFATISPLAWFFIYLVTIPILSSAEVAASTKSYIIFFIIFVGIFIFMKYKASFEQRIGQAWSLQPERMVKYKVLLFPFITHLLLSGLPLLVLLNPVQTK